MNLIPYVFILRADWLRTWFGSHINRDVPAFLISVVLFTHIRVFVGGWGVLFWVFWWFFFIAEEGKSVWTQKTLVMKGAVISYSTGYFMVSCPHISLVTRSLGQMFCMMLYCFFSLNDETLLQHGRCSPGRKFNLQHKNMQSTDNPSQYFHSMY